jgi:drug/metabolite transporter (DMT)-like permease
MAGRTGDADGATVGAFAAVVVVGGANFVAVKDTVEELDPLYGAAMRFGLACLIFFAILVARRIPLPRGRALAGAALYGLLGFGTAYAPSRRSSSSASRGRIRSRRTRSACSRARRS